MRFFFPSITSCPSVQKFSLIPLETGLHKIWCQSLIEFDRLRPFPVIRRLLSICLPRSSLIEFDAVRSTSIKFAFLIFVFSYFRVFVISFHLKFAEREIIKRITKARKHEKIRLYELSTDLDKMTDRSLICLFSLRYRRSVQKLFASVLLDLWFQDIWCQSSIKFVRLRPFLVIRRLLSIFLQRSSLIEFDAVRSPSTEFAFLIFVLSYFRD